MSGPSLVEKYEELVRLREEREALEARGVLELDGEEGRARKARCRALAARFPGALRELEHLDAAALRHRLTRARVAEVPAFERFVARYHALGRVMRHLKRWQGAHRSAHGRHPTPAEASEELARAGHASMLAPEEVEEWLTPPGGRVQDALWRKLARELEAPPDVLKNALLTGGAETGFLRSGPDDRDAS